MAIRTSWATAWLIGLFRCSLGSNNNKTYGTHQWKGSFKVVPQLYKWMCQSRTTEHRLTWVPLSANGWELLAYHWFPATGKRITPWKPIPTQLVCSRPSEKEVGLMSIIFHKFSLKRRKNKEEIFSRDDNYCVITKPFLIMVLPVNITSGDWYGHFMSQKPKATGLQKSSLKRLSSTQPALHHRKARWSKPAVCQPQISKAKGVEHLKLSWGLWSLPHGAYRPSAPRLPSKSHSLSTAAFLQNTQNWPESTQNHV